MNAPSLEGQRQYGEDEAATSCLTVLTAALPLGLLAASSALPLHWLAGQVALTVLCLLTLAASSVWSTSKVAGMDILSARLYGRTILTSQLAVTAMLCIVLPVAEARVRGTSGDPFSWGYGLASLLSIALCGVTVAHGTSRTRVWTLLKVQAWEIADEGGSRVGSMSRDLLAAQTRLSLAAGTLVLAVALLAQRRAGPGPEIATWLGAAAFAVYLVCALALAGLSAHRSKMAQWRLAGSDVAARVDREWRRAGANMVLLSLALAALLVVTRVSSAVRALGAWLWDGLILPLLRLLPWSWFKLPAAKPCLSSACAHAGAGKQSFAPPALPKVQAHSSAGIWALLGDLWHALTHAVQYLAGQWPVLLCLVAVIALARVYLSSGRGQGVRRFFGHSATCSAATRGCSGGCSSPRPRIWPRAPDSWQRVARCAPPRPFDACVARLPATCPRGRPSSHSI